MSSSEQESVGLQVVRQVLDRLAKLRLQKGGWIDSDQDVENETLAFKIGEALRCFLIARELAPTSFPQITLNRVALNKDIKRVFASVEKDGFFPSPYSAIPSVSDQYVDFAAFCLEFSALVYDYATETRQRTLLAGSKSLASRALQFLVNPSHFLTDEAGCRWAGTNVFARTKRGGVVELFTDVYFTSLAVIALNRVLHHAVLSLSKREKTKLSRLIANAGKWIVSQSERGQFRGNENGSKKLIYATWGLRALIETFDLQEDEVKLSVLPLASAYVESIAGSLQSEPVSIGQEYLYVLAPSVGEPLPYEDRSGWGGVLLTLVALCKLSNSRDLLESLNYDEVVDRVFSGIILLRDPISKLWYRDYFVLSIHSYITEAFILLDRYSDFGMELRIRAGMIRKALQAALSDDTVLNVLQQTVYEYLTKLSRQEEQNRIIAKGLEALDSTRNSS